MRSRTGVVCRLILREAQDDIGVAEENIFTRTFDALSAFRLAKPVLERLHFLAAVHAEYRPAVADDFTVSWPRHSQQAFVSA